MTSAATFSFHCQCGARLQARPEMAGKKGKCKFCGAMFVIPTAPAAAHEIETPAAPSSKPQPAVASAPGEQICSICLTEVQPAEDAGKCDSCGLPFHLECWHANLGCATYGCRNVNCLKTGPDIAIGPAMVQAQTPTRHAAAKAPPSAIEEIPWEYVFLAAAAVAGLLSCFMCGVPSLGVGLAAAIYASQASHAKQNVLVWVWVISGLTFFLGMMSSIVIYAVT
jgi:hypothetical protein